MTTNLSAGSVRPGIVTRWRGWALVLAAAWIAPTAQAALVRYDYQGVVTTAAPETHVAPGSKFSGSFSFDPAATPSLVTHPGGNAVQYVFGRTPTVPASVADDSGLNIQVGNRTGYTLMGGLGLSVDSGASSSQIQVMSKPADPGPVAVALDFKNAGKSVLAASTPPPALRLSDFSQATLTMVADADTPNPRQLYQGTIESLTLAAPVPEPASLATWLGLGVIGALGWHRRFRRGD